MEFGFEVVPGLVTVVGPVAEVAVAMTGSMERRGQLLWWTLRDLGRSKKRGLVGMVLLVLQLTSKLLMHLQRPQLDSCSKRAWLSLTQTQMHPFLAVSRLYSEQWVACTHKTAYYMPDSPSCPLPCLTTYTQSYTWLRISWRSSLLSSELVVAEEVGLPLESFLSC